MFRFKSESRFMRTEDFINFVGILLLFLSPPLYLSCAHTLPPPTFLSPLVWNGALLQQLISHIVGIGVQNVNGCPPWSATGIDAAASHIEKQRAVEQHHYGEVLSVA